MKIMKKLTTFILILTLILNVTCLAVPYVSAAESNGFVYSEENGVITITGYNGPATAIVIPSVIDGKEVVAVGDKAFYNHTELKSLEVPASVKTIGSKIVNDFENHVFEKLILCEGLDSVEVMAFYGCEALKNVKIPASVKNIGSSAFGVIDSINEIDFITKGFILDCYAGTAGETYARANNMNYRLCDGEADTVYQSIVNAVLYDKNENEISGIVDLAYRYYTGKEVKPVASVKVKSYDNKTVELKKNDDYSIEYRNNVNVGVAKIVIKGKGNYYGTKVVSFKIRPEKSKVMSVVALGKSKVKVRWSKSAQSTGYKIYYSSNKGKTYKTGATIRKGSVTAKTIKLKKNKTYCVKVVPFAKKDGRTYFSKAKNKLNITVK